MKEKSVLCVVNGYVMTALIGVALLIPALFVKSVHPDDIRAFIKKIGNRFRRIRE